MLSTPRWLPNTQGFTRNGDSPINGGSPAGSYAQPSPSEEARTAETDRVMRQGGLELGDDVAVYKELTDKLKPHQTVFT